MSAEPPTPTDDPCSAARPQHQAGRVAEDAEGRPGRRYLGALAACLVLVLGLAWVAGRQSMAGAPAGPKSLDAVRLGPEPGRSVADYLADLPARLPAPGAAPVPALVQFDGGLDVPAAARVVSGGADAGAGGPPSGAAGLPAPVTAVLRVRIDRVQTALRFQPLTPVSAGDPVAGTERRLTLARAAARRAAAADAARLTGRAAVVAAAEAAALDRPDCPCVLAVLVVADRATLEALAVRPEVRAVDAAPEGTPDDGVALSPLLPEQTRTAGPTPDDGPLPPR